MTTKGQQMMILMTKIMMVVVMMMIAHGLDLWQLFRCWAVQVSHVDQLSDRHLYYEDDSNDDDNDGKNDDFGDDETFLPRPSL